MDKEQELRALQAEICQALLNAFPMDDKVADAHAAVAAKIIDAHRSATAEAWRGIAPDGRTGLTDNRRVVEKWEAEGREVIPLCTARRSSSDEQAEVVAGGVEWREGCATVDCMRPGTEYFESGGVGSHYCPECLARIRALGVGDEGMGEAEPFTEEEIAEARAIWTRPTPPIQGDAK